MRRLVEREQQALEDRENALQNKERLIMIAIAVGLVAFIPSVVLGVLLWHEVDQRSSANRALIVEVQRHERALASERAQVRRAIRQADIENCQEDEVVKKRLRDLVAFNEDEALFTLEQLGIPPDSTRGRALIERARLNSARAVAALAPKDCEQLPDPTLPGDG